MCAGAFHVVGYQEAEEYVGSSGAADLGDCELPGAGAGNIHFFGPLT